MTKTVICVDSRPFAKFAFGQTLHHTKKGRTLRFAPTRTPSIRTHPLDDFAFDAVRSRTGDSVEINHLIFLDRIEVRRFVLLHRGQQLRRLVFLHPIDLITLDVFLLCLFPCQTVASRCFLHLQRRDGKRLDGRNKTARHD